MCDFKFRIGLGLVELVQFLFLESSLPYAYKFCILCSRYVRSRGGGFSHACLMSPRDRPPEVSLPDRHPE